MGFEVLVVVGSTLVLTVVVGRVVTLLAVVVVVRCVVVLRGFAVVLTGGRALGLLVLIVFTGAGAFLGEAELVEFLGAGPLFLLLPFLSSESPRPLPELACFFFACCRL